MVSSLTVINQEEGKESSSIEHTHTHIHFFACDCIFFTSERTIFHSVVASSDSGFRMFLLWLPLVAAAAAAASNCHYHWAALIFRPTIRSLFEIEVARVINGRRTMLRILKPILLVSLSNNYRLLVTQISSPPSRVYFDFHCVSSLSLRAHSFVRSSLSLSRCSLAPF